MKDRTTAHLTLRKARESDAKFLLAVRNLPEVRAQSKNQDVIPDESHRRWLRVQLADQESGIWIVEARGQDAGYVRAEKMGDGMYLLSIALDEPFRGKGCGDWAIWEISRLLRESYGARSLIAEVFSTNPGARRLFESAGFVPSAKISEAGRTLTRFELSLAIKG